MENWKQFTVAPTTPAIKALEIIDTGGIQIAFVVNGEGHLLGTLTDGDVRRALLNGISLQEPVQTIMNKKPICAGTADTQFQIMQKMKSKQVRQIPVVDKDGRLLKIEILSELLKTEEKENWVVIMAGGLGTRLRPLTDNLPKSLLPVGNRPLLEITLENLIEQGFKNFFLCVNYKAEMIENHFKDGLKWNVNIKYVLEKTQMGTAGALGLLPQKPSKPILVMNGDLLTKVNYNQLFEFHHGHKADATMCVREYDFQVPYGVVKIDNSSISNIDEKPIQRFFVNAGIYVLEPSCLDLIPPASSFDMPALFDRLIQKNHKTSAFPIREYWLDVGKLTDLERANGDFGGDTE